MGLFLLTMRENVFHKNMFSVNVTLKNDFLSDLATLKSDDFYKDSVILFSYTLLKL